jgi:hypothetical protein
VESTASGASIATPARSQARPGIRFDLIDYALAPFTDPAGPAFLPPDAMARLKQELAFAEAAAYGLDAGRTTDEVLAAAFPGDA